MTDPLPRAESLEALHSAMRTASALGVLFSEAVAARVGLSSSDLECLDLVNLRGEVSAGDLARASGLTTGAITGVIDRMERGGFVTRRPDPNDRRKVRVAPVPEAAERVGLHYAEMQTAMNALLARYEASELAVLHGFFRGVETVMTEQIGRVRAR